MNHNRGDVSLPRVHEAGTSESRSRSATRGRRTSVEPSRSRSRPRTTVADALAGRIAVGLGTPAVRSSSLSRTGGGSGGGGLGGGEGGFVHGVVRHGRQTSVDWHAVSLGGGAGGGYDSAAGSRRTIGAGTEDDARSEGGRSDISDASMQSKSSAAGVSTAKSSKRRWRFSLSPTKRSSKGDKPRRSSSYDEGPAVVRIAAHEPPDSNFRTRAAARKRAKDASRQAARQAADDAAAEAAAEAARAACARHAAGGRSSFGNSSRMSSSSRGGYSGSYDFDSETEDMTELSAEGSAVRFAEDGERSSGRGGGGERIRQEYGRNSHILARNPSSQGGSRGSYGSSSYGSLSDNVRSSSGPHGDGSWSTPHSRTLDEAGTSESQSHSGSQRDCPREERRRDERPRLEQPHQAAMVTARARSNGSGSGSGSDSEGSRERKLRGRGARPGSEGQRLESQPHMLLASGGPWPHWATSNVNQSGRNLLGGNSRSTNNDRGPSPASSVKSWPSTASSSGSSSSSSSSSNLSTSSSHSSSHRPSGRALGRSSSSVSSARGSSLLGYGGPLPSPVMEGEESSGGSASSGAGSGGREKRRASGSRGFERPVRTSRKLAEKKSVQSDAEQEHCIRFSGAWSGEASAAGVSPPPNGYGEIPTSPASRLQVALERDEAAEKEQAKVEAAAAAAAVAITAAAAPRRRDMECSRGSGGSTRKGTGKAETARDTNNDEDTSSLFSSDYFSAEEGQSTVSLGEYSIATTDAASAYSSTFAGGISRGDASSSAAAPVALGNTGEEATKLDEATDEEQLRRSFTREASASTSTSSDSSFAPVARTPGSITGGKYSIARTSKYSTGTISRDSIATTDVESAYSITPTRPSREEAATAAATVAAAAGAAAAHEQMQLSLDKAEVERQLERSVGGVTGTSPSSDHDTENVEQPGPTSAEADSSAASYSRRQLDHDAVRHHLRRSFSSETGTSASSDRSSLTGSVGTIASTGGDKIGRSIGGSEEGGLGDKTYSGDMAPVEEDTTAAETDCSLMAASVNRGEGNSQCHSWIWNDCPSTPNCSVASKGIFSECVGDSTSATSTPSPAPSRIWRAKVSKRHEDQETPSPQEASQKTTTAGVRTTDTNIFDEPQAQVDQLPVPSPLMTQVKHDDIDAEPVERTVPLAGVQAQQSETDQRPEFSQEQSSSLPQKALLPKSQPVGSNNVSQRWSFSTPATQSSPETAAASSPPQISPPKLEQLTQQLSSLERQQLHGQQQQNETEEEQQDTHFPAQSQPPARSLLQQLSRRLERLQQRQSSGGEEDSLTTTPDEAVRTPPNAEAMSHDSAERADNHDDEDDEQLQHNDAQFVASPSEPVGLALLPRDSPASSEKRSPGRSILSQISHRLENLQRRASPSPPPAAAPTATVEPHSEAAEAAAAGASAILPTHPEQAQTTQASPQPSPPQLQQLTARLSDHCLQQQLRGRGSPSRNLVPPQEQTPPPQSPQPLPAREGREESADTTPAAGVSSEQAVIPTPSSSSLSFSPDREVSPQISPPMLSQLSQRLEEDEGTPARPHRAPSVLPSQLVSALQQEQRTLGQFDEKLDQATAKRVPAAETMRSPASGSQMPQRRVLESDSPAEVSPLPSVSSGSSGSSSKGESPKEIAQPKVEQRVHPRPRQGPRLLPSPEQLAARRLLQLPAPQPNQAAHQLRVAEQSEAAQLTEDISRLASDDQALEEEIKAEEKPVELRVAGPMRQIKAALLQAEQPEAQKQQQQDTSGDDVLVAHPHVGAVLPTVTKAESQVGEGLLESDDANPRASGEEQGPGVDGAQQQQAPDFERSPWAFGETEAANDAREATALALALGAEEAAAAAAAAAAAIGLTASYSGGSGEGSDAGGIPLERCSLMSAADQEAVCSWLVEGVVVKKWTAGGGGTRKRKLRLQKVEKKGSSAGGGGGSSDQTSTMQWAAWAKGGEVEAGGAEGGGEDGQWKLLLQSGKTKGKDVVHRLSNLRDVSEDRSDKSVTLFFEGGGEPEGKIRALFPTQQPVAQFFRQIAENRKSRERVSRAAKAALVALEKGANARATVAAAQDTSCRWQRDAGLQEMEEACRDSDVIETQLNLSVLAANHVKDARLAKAELEGIVQELIRFETGVRQRPTHLLTEDGIEEEALTHYDGDVTRVLNAVQMTVVCRGAKEAAKFCRQLKAHPQVNAIMWRDMLFPQVGEDGKSRKEFQGARGFVELKNSQHVAQLELRREKFLGTAGVDYKSIEWARALKVPIASGSAPCLRFDEIRAPVKERMVALARQDWMALHSVLPQLLQATGDVDEAEGLLRQNASEEKAMHKLAHRGEDDNDQNDSHRAEATASSATAMTELAIALQQQGKLSEAEELFRSALDMRKGVLGPDHPCVALSASNLAGVLRDQGRRAEATSVMLSTMDVRVVPASATTNIPARAIPIPFGTRSESEVATTPSISSTAPTPTTARTTGVSAARFDSPLVRSSVSSSTLTTDVDDKVNDAPEDRASASMPETVSVELAPYDSTKGNAAPTEVAVDRGEIAAGDGAKHDGIPDAFTSPGRGGRDLDDSGMKYGPGRPTQFPPMPSPPVADEMVDHRADSKTNEMTSPDTIGYASPSSTVSLVASTSNTPNIDVSVGTAAAVAAAVTAVSAGVHAKTARFASFSASASAKSVIGHASEDGLPPAVMDRSAGAVGSGAAVGKLQEDEAKFEEKQREYESRAREEEDAIDREWELAHSVAVASLNNLAVLLSEQGDAEQAEGFHRRALRAREIVHGPGHPDMPILLSNLAGTLYVQGKDSEAEPLHQRALQLREALLGSRHPDVATSLEFLARMALKRGRTYTEMEGLVARLVDAREACLTKTNAPPAIEGRRQVGSVMSDLAVALRRQPKEQAVRAFPLFRRVFLSDEKILGSYHALVAEDVVNLAEVMSAQGNLSNAEELHRRALKIRQYTLGDDHPSTVASLCHLAVSLRDQGKTHAGELLLRRAGEIRSKTRGSSRFNPQGFGNTGRDRPMTEISPS